MKAERTVPSDDAPVDASPTDESLAPKVLTLRPVKSPHSWDPYEVWRTRVKPKSDESGAQE